MMIRIALVTAAALVLAGPPLEGQDTTRAAAPGAKDPLVARVVAIVPGAGHIYAGETMRGLAYTAGIAGIFLLGATLWATECVASWGERCEESATLTDDITIFATFGLWGWSIYDAGRAAHRTNAKRRSRVSLILAPARSISPRAGDGRGVRLGLSLALPLE